MIRRTTNLIGAALLLAAAAFSAAACAGGRQSDAGAQQSGATQTAAPAPAKVTAAELAKLRWIEGSWRGTGDVERPFYERYRFEGDALLVEGFADETLSKADDVTRFELKDGEFGGGGGGAHWAASEIKDDSITFVPVRGARNSFRWQKGEDGTWAAVLEWPAAEGKPARRRVYRMERWPQSK